MRAAVTRGSALTAATIGESAAVDPHGTTEASCSMNGFTVAYRPASSARHSRSPSSSLEGSGSSSATVASAASSCSRVTTWTTALTTSVAVVSFSAPSCPTWVGGVSRTIAHAAASRAAATRSRGRFLSFSLSAARPACDSSLVDISRSNSSSASSTETPSRCRTVASSVAARRLSSSCLIRNALAVTPNRASSAIFTGATAPQSTAPVPSPSTYADRSNASHIPVPDSLVTGVRIHSSTDTFLPSGTVSVATSSPRMCGGAASASAELIAASSARRTSATSRDSVLIPGSSTRFSISHSTARSNSSRRESRVLATREAMNAATSPSAAENSRYPSRSRICVA